MSAPTLEGAVDALNLLIDYAAAVEDRELAEELKNVAHVLAERAG